MQPKSVGMAGLELFTVSNKVTPTAPSDRVQCLVGLGGGVSKVGACLGERITVSGTGEGGPSLLYSAKVPVMYALLGHTMSLGH